MGERDRNRLALQFKRREVRERTAHVDIERKTAHVGGAVYSQCSASLSHQAIRHERKCSKSKHPGSEQLVSGTVFAGEEGGHGRIVHSSDKSKLRDEEENISISN